MSPGKVAWTKGAPHIGDGLHTIVLSLPIAKKATLSLPAKKSNPEVKGTLPHKGGGSEGRIDHASRGRSRALLLKQGGMPVKADHADADVAPNGEETLPQSTLGAKKE